MQQALAPSAENAPIATSIQAVAPAKAAEAKEEKAEKEEKAKAAENPTKTEANLQQKPPLRRRGSEAAYGRKS